MKNSHLKAVIVLTACLLIAASAVAQLAINTTGNEFATTQSQSGANGKTAPGAVQMCLNAQGVAIPADAAGVNCKGGGGASSNFGSTFPTSGTAIGFTDGTNMVAGKVWTPGSNATTADPAIVVVDPNVKAAVAAATIALGPAAIVSSIPVIPSSQYPGNNVAAANPITAASGNIANASAVATLPGVASKTTFITGFEITSDGAGTGACFNPTVTGTITGTLTYTYCVPTGVLLAATPLIVPFSIAIPASAANTSIVVTLPALGTGSTNATVVAHGYQL